MAAGINPVFPQTPNVGVAQIVQTSAQVKSDGTSAGTAGADIMYKAFTIGANGSLVEEARFHVCASAAATNSVATTLRAYWSSVSDPSAAGTTAANTHLIGEVSVPIISASHSTNATNYYSIILNKFYPSGYIHVSQHVAQTANQSWKAIVYGWDY